MRVTRLSQGRTQAPSPGTSRCSHTAAPAAAGLQQPWRRRGGLPSGVPLSLWRHLHWQVEGLQVGLEFCQPQQAPCSKPLVTTLEKEAENRSAADRTARSGNCPRLVITLKHGCTAPGFPRREKRSGRKLVFPSVPPPLTFPAAVSSLCVRAVAQQLHHVGVVGAVSSMVVLLVVHFAPLSDRKDAPKCRWRQCTRS